MQRKKFSIVIRLTTVYAVCRRTFTYFSLETLKKGNWQTVQTQIRRRRMRRLIRVSAVYKQFCHYSLGIPKSHSLTCLKLKFDCSNIQCVGASLRLFTLIWDNVAVALKNQYYPQSFWICRISPNKILVLIEGVVGCGKGVVYLASPGRPTDIGLQLGKACCPCSRYG